MMGLTEPLVLLLLVLVFVVGPLAAAFWALKKAKRRLAELQAQDEALSRRCDELTRRLEAVETLGRLDHLRDLVRSGVAGGRLDAASGERLQSYLDELEADGLETEADNAS